MKITTTTLKKLHQIIRENPEVSDFVYGLKGIMILKSGYDEHWLRIKNLDDPKEEDEIVLEVYSNDTKTFPTNG